jgi:hypothetical protein
MSLQRLEVQKAYNVQRILYATIVFVKQEPGYISEMNINQSRSCSRSNVLPMLMLQ